MNHLAKEHTKLSEYGIRIYKVEVTEQRFPKLTLVALADPSVAQVILDTLGESSAFVDCDRRPVYIGV